MFLQSLILEYDGSEVELDISPILQNNLEAVDLVLETSVL